ncbi:MAG: non-canonical purine NTP pyrophosphatase [Brevinema sp.]
MKLFIATQNKHKIEEITAVLSTSLKIVTPTESLNIMEGSRSYIENALIKANIWAEKYPDHYILSDDSGLEVEYLDNAPGVISSEWAGVNSTQQDLINKLLVELENIPFEKRSAKFVCYMLLRSPDGQNFVSRGECAGRIAMEISGSKGFGYDPLFLPEAHQFKKSLADLSFEEKNMISHRKKSLIGIHDFLNFLHF